jgi:uncharacterized Zn finger protein (UPF0148 family)
MGILTQVCKACGLEFVGNPVFCPRCGTTTKSMKVTKEIAPSRIPNALPETKEHYVNKLMKVAHNSITQDHVIFMYHLEIPYLEAKYKLEKLSAKLTKAGRI